MKNVAIILASGTGSRCNLGFPKQFAEVGGKTVLEHTIDKFEEHSLIDEIISQQECFSIKDLKINGNDLISMGFNGKEIGKILNNVLERVINETLANNYNDIRDFIISNY